MDQYPKWIYSATGARVIQSEAEHPGDGWYESPADIPAEPEEDVAEAAPEKRKPGRPRKEA